MGVLLVWVTVRGEINLDAVLGFFLLSIFSVWVLLELNSTLLLDEKGLIAKGWRGESVLKWSEIGDVQISAHILSITAGHRNVKIVLRHGEYAGIGIGFEPFEDLCQEVAQRALPRLSDVWLQQGLPFRCRYPGITRSMVAVYVVPLLLIVAFFVLFVTMTEGMVVGKVLFLVFGLLAIVPFWLRDYRKNCSTLTVTQEGIAENDGQGITLPWSDIQEIILTEEPIGLGWIIVKGKSGKKIQIPRSLHECGRVLYWLRWYTNLSAASQPVITEEW